MQDLNDALIFAKVVEKGSFTGAGRVLGIPKTTVSRKIQELEERLGAKLLHRTTRNLGLTEAGSVYFNYSSRIARELDEAASAVQQLEERPRGWLRVTAPFTMCSEVMAVLIHGYRELYPDVRIDLVLDNDRLDLVANQIDVALRVGPLPDSRLVARTLARYRSFVYASDDYLRQRGEPREPGELADHPVLGKRTDRRGNRYTWLLSNGERTEEVTVHPVAVANDPYALRMLLAGGHGMMLVSEIVIACSDARQGRVRRVLPDWSGPETVLSAVFPGGGLVSPKVRTFVDFVARRLNEDPFMCSSVAVAAAQASAETDEALA
ncbi:LysR substrate-binding domain-containing protein [Aquisalimonas lutea]|uniref:LysR family transcriptional regulator n=1 Tax=Aquisalimonas lutea TaxID=1327750 RepID=UPI0025B4F390|nr:LysR family transcriptional regulator [Aquisalimonas lutea]MDN3517578.1 LysR substrate-binding domain-containing protein [Aquisalimonas lutea]